MSENKNLQDKRPVIYPHNFEKVEELLRASNLQNATQLVNYLIEAAEVQQITKITFTNERTKKSFSIIRTSPKYKPNQW